MAQPDFEFDLSPYTSVHKVKGHRFRKLEQQLEIFESAKLLGGDLIIRINPPSLYYSVIGFIEINWKYCPYVNDSHIRYKDEKHEEHIKWERDNDSCKDFTDSKGYLPLLGYFDARSYKWYDEDLTGMDDDELALLLARSDDTWIRGIIQQRIHREQQIIAAAIRTHCQVGSSVAFEIKVVFINIDGMSVAGIFRMHNDVYEFEEIQVIWAQII
jgi:hypothetical protein